MAWKRKTIDLTEAEFTDLDKIVRIFGFNQQGEAYKFCFSIAWIQGLKASVRQNKRTTKWATGNFDEDGSFEALFIASCPPDSDYSDILESTASAGMEFVLSLVDEGVEDLGKVIRKALPEVQNS